MNPINIKKMARKLAIFFILSLFRGIGTGLYFFGIGGTSMATSERGKVQQGWM